MYVPYSFLDNRYRTTLLSFHLNRNLISKVASLLLFTLCCITYLRRREMNPIAFLFQFYTVPDVYNVKCIHFKWAGFCITFLPASHYKTDLIQTINYTALQLSRMKFNSMEWYSVIYSKIIKKYSDYFMNKNNKIALFS